MTVTNPFVFACITPHGLPVIEELAGSEPDLMKNTRVAMEQIGNWMTEAQPETIIILTPHGLKIEGQFCVTDSSYVSGTMSEQTVAQMVREQREDDGHQVHCQRTVDRTLARAIVKEAAAAGLPVGALNFQTSEGPFSTLPLDWGVMVPLYFMPKTEVVVVTPPRTSRTFADHVRFGEALGKAVKESGKRVALIASCDWSHAHDADGPYGFHPDAKRLDEEVVALLKESAIEEMSHFDMEYIENARPDGIWQALILAGAVPKAERNPEFLSYDVPTYFGMMCVGYR